MQLLKQKRPVTDQSNRAYQKRQKDYSTPLEALGIYIPRAIEAPIDIAVLFVIYAAVYQLLVALKAALY